MAILKVSEAIWFNQPGYKQFYIFLKAALPVGCRNENEPADESEDNNN